MRPVPESIGKFTSRELFLLNCIRDLERRLARCEAVLRMDNEQLLAAFRELPDPSNLERRERRAKA